MVVIGSHVSYKNESQLKGCVEEIIKYGGNAFMFYTGAPQNTQRGLIDDMKTIEALSLMKEHHIALEHVICHAPYIVNLGNDTDQEKYDFSVRFLREEIDRCETLGVRYIVLHPGNALKLDRSYALENIARGLNKILREDDDIMILLETMAGKGTELGITIDELVKILENVTLKEKVGICLDTCHLHDSGIDMKAFDDYLEEFDKRIGLSKIGCVHVNDSKNVLGSHKDRHENIGFGLIGFDSLLHVIYHEKLKDVPKILETPYIDRIYPPYKQEIQMIIEKKFNEHLIEDILKEGVL